MRYFLVLIFLISISSAGQTAKYFIEFTDKNNNGFSIDKPLEFLSERSVSRRARQNINYSIQDLPVNKIYKDSLSKSGAIIWYTSRWMNAALIEADAVSLEKIKAFSFIKKDNIKNFDKVSARLMGNKARLTSQKENTTVNNGQATKKKLSPSDYGNSYNQDKMIGVDEMHNQGFNGQGMRVAIFDSGFKNANQLKCFQHLFSNNKIITTYDFVRNEPSVYEDDGHGLNVFSVMGAYQPGSLIGPSYQADYVLLRTEDASSEYRIEEINWLIAAEFADSLGVDVINSSLGYSSFDNPKMNYKTGDMNGKTALITKAADIAASKGMLVVCSAGNEGDNPWQIITAPADADSVLTVGAVDDNQTHVNFSSIGPTADGRVKPDVCAQGLSTVLCSPSGNIISSSGTSFSSPLMAAMATGFWQAHPELNNMQVINYLRRSGNNFSTPNYTLGYGVPDFKKADQLVKIDQLIEKDKYLIAPNPIGEGHQINIYLNKLFVNELATIQVINSAGKIIYGKNNYKTSTENQLVLPHKISSGIYLLKLKTPSLQISEKIIVQ